MLNLFQTGRAIFIGVAFSLLAACTQTSTGSSSYNGSIGPGTLTEKQRTAKLLAARKRAKKNREAKRKAFLAKRAEAAKARKARKLGKKSSAKNAKKVAKVKSRRGSASKKKLRKSSKKRASQRVKKIVKLKSVSKTYAYVGGRSRGISTNKKPWGCVPPRLKRVISQVSKKFGRVVINSTKRSRRYNRMVGGKRRSYHLRCQAIDFRVKGRTRGLTRWLARHPSVGGFKRYRSGYYHIDTGPKRTW